MSAFLGKLSEMLFEQNEVSTPVTARPETQPEPHPVSDPPSPESAKQVEPVGETEVLKILRTQVENRSATAQETLAKFAKSLQVLEEFIPDENVRYRAAVSQISAGALLIAYRCRREALNAIKVEFKQAVTAAAEGQIKQNQNKIATLDAEIKSLSERLTSLVGERERLSGEVAEQESKINQKGQEFAAAAQAIEADIAANESRLNKMMPAEKDAK